MQQRPQDEPGATERPTGAIHLASYRQQSVVLPEGVNAIARSQAREEQTLSDEAVKRLFKQAIREDILSLERNVIDGKAKVLVLLPDATRGQEASRLLLDCLLELSQEFSTLALTIIFGLGTHPLMKESDIIEALGEHRHQQLIKNNIAIKQQTSLSPLPTRTLAVDVTLQTQDRPSELGPKIEFFLPRDLWNNHFIYIAGNTEIHPYETRCGSGGIHKMITVGLGAEATITTTHSARVLRNAGPIGHPQPNRFVRILEAHANAIIHALLSGDGSQLHQPPRGFNVCLNSSKAIIGCQTSSTDDARRPLTELLLEEKSIAILEPVNFVVNDPEPNKMTDILAGARDLHMLCESDNDENPILDRHASSLTALLFNTCHLASNNNGIGNHGTVEHLLALKRFNLESNGANRDSRQKTLSRWSGYLSLRSEMPRALRIAGEAATRLSQQSINHSTRNEHLHSRLLNFLEYIRLHSDGTTLKLIAEVERLVAIGESAEAAAQLRKALEQQDIPRGLGEGGQRALRLLKILERFDRLLIATDNKAVIQFLEELDPIQCAQSQQRNLGIASIDLTLYSCQEAINIALAQHHQKPLAGILLQNSMLITLAKKNK